MDTNATPSEHAFNFVHFRTWVRQKGRKFQEKLFLKRYTLPFSILIATLVVADPFGRFFTVPLATWPKAPFPIILSTFTSSLATSQDRVLISRGAYSTFGLVFSFLDWVITFKGIYACSLWLPRCWVEFPGRISVGVTFLIAISFLKKQKRILLINGLSTV